MVASEVAGAQGAEVLIAFLQAHVAEREQLRARARKSAGEAAGEETVVEGRAMRAAGREESEAVLRVLGMLASHLPTSDRRVVRIAHTLLAAVASSSSSLSHSALAGIYMCIYIYTCKNMFAYIVGGGCRFIVVPLTFCFCWYIYVYICVYMQKYVRIPCWWRLPLRRRPSHILH